YPAGLLQRLLGGWLRVLQGVTNTEGLPLEAAHLVEGQHLDTLHVAELSRKGCDLSDVVQVIRQARNQHEAHPDGEIAGSEAPRQLEGRCVIAPGECTVPFTVPGLDTQQYQIDVVEIRVGELCTEKAVGLDRRVYPDGLRAGEHLHDEAPLHQRFATADR